MKSMSEGSSFHEIFVHPNEASLLPEEIEAEKKQGGLVKFFKKVDEQYLRPFFIYKYS